MGAVHTLKKQSVIKRGVAQVASPPQKAVYSSKWMAQVPSGTAAQQEMEKEGGGCDWHLPKEEMARPAVHEEAEKEGGCV